MDWIHCNKCFAQLAPGITLHLTSCGHMFCNTCLDNDVKDSVCIVCQLPCSIMKLVPDMKPEIQDYFTEPEEIIKKSCEVLQFQRQHRRRLLSYLLQSTKKFYSARTELRRVSELCQKQHAQLIEYKRTIKNLKLELTNQTKATSPFQIPLSQSPNALSPNMIQGSPSYKRPAKSTPYCSYQSNLVTSSRISKQRSNFSIPSQRSHVSTRMNSAVFTPPSTPESPGLSQRSVESGYYSGAQSSKLTRIKNCDGLGRSSFSKNRKKFIF